MIFRVTEGNVDSLKAMPCCVCHAEFVVGDDLLRIPIGPASKEDRLRMYGGHRYSSNTVYVHTQCCALEHSYRDIVPMLRNMIDDQRLLMYQVLDKLKMMEDKESAESLYQWIEKEYKEIISKYVNILRL